MSVFDCHINRSPVAGRVERIVYRAGKFISADLTKQGEDNERNAFVIVTGAGQRVVVVQIAGLIARRMSVLRANRRPGAGQRIGMIRFGSRINIYLPEGMRFSPAKDKLRLRANRDCRLPHARPKQRFAAGNIVAI